MTKSDRAKSIKRSPARKAPAKKIPSQPTATDQVLKIINRSKKGDNAATLMTKTGFDLKRALEVRQPGYISGETFFNLDRPEECLVIGRQTTIELWQKWYQDLRRIELDEKMEKHQLVEKSWQSWQALHAQNVIN